MNMYSKEQLNYLYSLIIDQTNNVFSLTNQIILDYLSITKSKKFIKPLKEEFYSVYDKDYITSICRQKQGRYGSSVRNSTPIRYSDEAKEKMKLSRRKFWESIRGTEREQQLKEISRNSMKQLHSLKLNQTEEVKAKRINSRKANNEIWHTDETREKISKSQIGKIVSEDTRKKQSDAARGKPKFDRRGELSPSKRAETRQKISESVKYLHRIGTYPLKVKSKGHCEIETILLNLGYDIINEARLGRFSYDILIKDLNTIIEFHGTYWHLDPNKYDKDFYDKSKDRFAYQQWERDDIRKSHAIAANYRYVVIWQQEWESLTDAEKIKKIKTIISYA